jgi:hypothetical protein
LWLFGFVVSGKQAFFCRYQGGFVRNAGYG